METYFEVPSQFHIGSWPWFAIFESSKRYVEFTKSEYNALEKIILMIKITNLELLKQTV